jgi:hypothetical protein
MLPSPKVSVIVVTKTGVPVAISSTAETSRPEKIIRTKRAKPATPCRRIVKVFVLFFSFSKRKKEMRVIAEG